MQKKKTYVQNSNPQEGIEQTRKYSQPVGQNPSCRSHQDLLTNASFQIYLDDDSLYYQELMLLD